MCPRCMPWPARGEKAEAPFLFYIKIPANKMPENLFPFLTPRSGSAKVGNFFKPQNFF